MTVLVHCITSQFGFLNRSSSRDSHGDAIALRLLVHRTVVNGGAASPDFVISNYVAFSLGCGILNDGDVASLDCEIDDDASVLNCETGNGGRYGHVVFRCASSADAYSLTLSVRPRLLASSPQLDNPS